MSEPKYPDVHVRLVGEDGNAMMIMGRTASALKRGGVSQEVVNEYMEQAMSGDYNNVLTTTMEYVSTT